MSKGKILVVAANGNVGASLVDELLRRGEKVKAASRKPVSAPTGAEPIRLDLQDASTIAGAGGRRSHLRAVAGFVGYLDQVGLLVASTRLPPARSRSCSRRRSASTPTTAFPFASSNSGWSGPNALRDPAAELVQRQFRRLIGLRGCQADPRAGGRGQVEFHRHARHRRCRGRRALTTDRHDGKAFVLTGLSAYSYGEAARLLSEALRRPIGYQSVDDATFVSEAIAGGVPEGYARLLAAIFHPVREGWTAIVTIAVETLSGKRGRAR